MTRQLFYSALHILWLPYQQQIPSLDIELNSANLELEKNNITFIERILANIKKYESRHTYVKELVKKLFTIGQIFSRRFDCVMGKELQIFPNAYYSWWTLESYFEVDTTESK